MRNLHQLVATEKRHQIALGIVFLLYIVADIRTPQFLSQMIDTTVGNAVVIILALSMLAAANPIIGVLGLVAAYELVQRSRASGGAISRSAIREKQTRRYAELQSISQDFRGRNSTENGTLSQARTRTRSRLQTCTR